MRAQLWLLLILFFVTNVATASCPEVLAPIACQIVSMSRHDSTAVHHGSA